MWCIKGWFFLFLKLNLVNNKNLFKIISGLQIASIVAPAGIGFRLMEINFDINKLATCLIIIFIIANLKIIIRNNESKAPIACSLLFSLSVVSVVNICMAPTIWSFYWGIYFVLANICPAWVLVRISNGSEDFCVFIKQIKVIFFILLAIALIEFLSQERLVAYRNLWPAGALENQLEMKRYYRLSTGPFASNHQLGIFLFFIGALLVDFRKRLVLVLLGVAIISTGMAAAIISFGFFLMGGAAFQIKNHQKSILPLAMTYCLIVLTLFSYPYVESKLKKTAVNVSPYSHLVNNEHVGSVESRFKSQFEIVNDNKANMIFGVGPGALVDYERVGKYLGLVYKSDVGIIQRFFIERGLFFVLILVVFLVLYFKKGRLSYYEGAGLLGLSAVWLSSPYGDLLPLVFTYFGLKEVKMNSSHTMDPRLVGQPLLGEIKSVRP